MNYPALQDAPVSTGRSNGAPQTVSLPHRDKAAFAATCASYLERVWRQLSAMGVAQRYVEDAAQEVFLIAYRKLDEFEGQAQLSTWLYAITYRVGCNYRRRARRDSREQPVDCEPRAPGSTPEQALESKRAAELVQRFCDGLSEKLRDVFVLCLLEEQPVAVVASLLELSENTVYSRIRLVRAAFRKELARLEAEAP